MIAVWVLSLFVLVSLVVWLLLFDGARAAVFAQVARWRAVVGARSQRGWSRTADHVDGTARQVGEVAGRAAHGLARHRWLLLASLGVIALPALLILGLRQRVALDGYEGSDVVRSDPQILALLRGERLAPPPALPPEVFLAAEAEHIAIAPGSDAIVQPEAIVTADRKWERIDPEFQQRVLAIYRVMREQYGYELVLVEGFRSAQRQAELARKGGRVTRAGAGESCHQYGIAVDSALYRNGKLQWNMQDPWVKRGYFLYGQLAQQAGLEWGGDWRRLKDYVHVEWKAPCRQQIVAMRAARASRG